MFFLCVYVVFGGLAQLETENPLRWRANTGRPQTKGETGGKGKFGEKKKKKRGLKSATLALLNIVFFLFARSCHSRKFRFLVVAGQYRRDTVGGSTFQDERATQK